MTRLGRPALDRHASWLEGASTRDADAEVLVRAAEAGYFDADDPSARSNESPSRTADRIVERSSELLGRDLRTFSAVQDVLEALDPLARGAYHYVFELAYHGRPTSLPATAFAEARRRAGK